MRNRQIIPGLQSLVAGCLLAAAAVVIGASITCPTRGTDAVRPNTPSPSPAVILVSAPQQEATPSRAFLEQHCIKCHGPDKQKGKVRLDDLPAQITDTASAQRWDDVLQVLELNQMPPEAEPELGKQQRRAMIARVQALISEGLAAHARYPHTPIRRMNRFQYNNAVVDLLDLKVELFALPERMLRSHSNYFDPASGKMPQTVKVGSRPLGKSQLIQPRLTGVDPFPQDLRAEHGFDNRGDHLSLSPLLMESFLELSGSIVNSRDFGPETCGVWESLFAPPADNADIPSAVRRRLRAFLTRAFRRTIDDDTLQRYAGHVLRRLEAGDAFTDAMKHAVSAALASPRFLYLYEQGVSGKDQPIDDFELASRLSFFFWSSIPDQALLDLAQAGRLREPAELDRQIDRMLNDKKIKRFCDTFPAQWLQLERIISSKPIGKAAEGFYLRRYNASMHMMAQPLLLFEAVLIEDRSIVDLIDPPFSYRSALLKSWMAGGNANPGPPGVMTFHRMANEDRREGGVITNPAVMTMTSGPERTKPITRGAWVATVVFNDAPNPPPADVPPLAEGKAETQHLTLREKLAAHRQREDCRSCHAKIDPYGFALENYGPTGRWRDHYDNGREVDASGVLLRTHAFSNPVEFKDAILAEKDRYTRAFAEHMLAYALGREVGVADARAIDTIVQTTTADGHRMRTLLKAVATSEPFSIKGDPEQQPGLE